MSFKLKLFIFLVLICLLLILLIDLNIHNKFLKYIYIFIKFILLFIIYILLFKNNKNNIEVLLDKPNPEDAIKIIDKVNKNLNDLLEYIYKKFDDENLDNMKMHWKKKIFIRKVIKDLKKNYNSNNIKEHFPKVHNYQTSFNVNKGEKIHLCLRNFLTDNFHSFNDIMFVAIHELSHCCHHSQGHKKDFWIIFRFLLENANEIKIYEITNYKENPFYYCSTNVTYNPIFDKTLDDNIYFKHGYFK